jgi:uncharacterized spore protein YtfJ
MSQTPDDMASFAAQLRTQNEKVIEKLYAAAQPGAVFSAPVVNGEYTVITASEIGAAGGFGFGMGTAPRQSNADESGEDNAGGGGGGGGGGSAGRPVAAIVIGPDGVKIRPIVDATKLAIAVIGAWSAVALVAVRLARTARR